MPINSTLDSNTNLLQKQALFSPALPFSARFWGNLLRAETFLRFSQSFDKKCGCAWKMQKDLFFLMNGLQRK
jgi:hypothetical protein